MRRNSQKILKILTPDLKGHFFFGKPVLVQLLMLDDHDDIWHVSRERVPVTIAVW